MTPPKSNPAAPSNDLLCRITISSGTHEKTFGVPAARLYSEAKEFYETLPPSHKITYLTIVEFQAFLDWMILHRLEGPEGPKVAAHTSPAQKIPYWIPTEWRKPDGLECMPIMRLYLFGTEFKITWLRRMVWDILDNYFSGNMVANSLDLPSPLMIHSLYTCTKKGDGMRAFMIQVFLRNLKKVKGDEVNILDALSEYPTQFSENVKRRKVKVPTWPNIGDSPWEKYE